MSYPHGTRWKKSPYQAIIFTKFPDNRTKNLGFLNWPIFECVFIFFCCCCSFCFAQPVWNHKRAKATKLQNSINLCPIFLGSKQTFQSQHWQFEFFSSFLAVESLKYSKWPPKIWDPFFFGYLRVLLIYDLKSLKLSWHYDFFIQKMRWSCHTYIFTVKHFHYQNFWFNLKDIKTLINLTV